MERAICPSGNRRLATRVSRQSGVFGRRTEASGSGVDRTQTYYGAVNLLTRDIHLKAFPAGKAKYTVDYLRWLRDLYPNKPIILLWDGATYHRGAQVEAFLTEVNAGREESQ